MTPPFLRLNAWDIWEKCGGVNDHQAQKNFWSDVVLYVKTNPGRSAFFENLIKNIGLKNKNTDYLNTPLPVTVKKLIKASFAFDRLFWADVVAEWSQIKIDLKMMTQAVILKNNALLKRFVQGLFGKADNPKIVAVTIAGELGLPKRYHKSDIILMFCSIVADALSEEIVQKELEMEMGESIFQIADDTIMSVETPPIVETGGAALEGRSLFPDNQPLKSFRDLWETFLSEFSALDPLAADWAEVEQYVVELTRIAEKKGAERQAILKRRELISDFTQKTKYLFAEFDGQLDALGIDLPTLEQGEQLTDIQMELYLGEFSGLTKALEKYKEFSGTKKAGLHEEKKRIAFLLTAITDIENSMAVITQALQVVEEQQVEKQVSEVVQVQEIVTQVVAAEEIVPKEQGDIQEDSSREETDNGQFELFIGKDIG